MLKEKLEFYKVRIFQEGILPSITISGNQTSTTFQIEQIKAAQV